MTELVADMLPWFAAFYVLDAVVQLRRGQWVFNRGLGGDAVLRAGIHAAALAPTDVAVFAHDLPFLPAVDGIYVVDPDARAPIPVVRPEALKLIPWDALKAATVERTSVKCRGQMIFRARSPQAARRVLAQLKALRDAAPEQRGLQVKEGLAVGFDLAAARERAQGMRRPLLATRAFATAEFLLLFLGLPYAAFWSLEETRWERVGLALLLAHLGTLISAAWTLRRAGVAANAISGAVTMLAIFPAYAARAAGQVARDAFLTFEPSVIAAALLREESWLRFARQECVRLEESATATQGLGLEAYWAARRAALEKMLRAAGTSRQQVLVTPTFSAEVAGFCPLCLGEYRHFPAACADCGVALLPPAPATAATSVAVLSSGT